MYLFPNFQRINIKIFRIISWSDKILYQSQSNPYFVQNYSFKWNVDKDLMNTIINQNGSKCFLSPIINNHWCLQL